MKDGWHACAIVDALASKSFFAALREDRLGSVWDETSQRSKMHVVDGVQGIAIASDVALHRGRG